MLRRPLSINSLPSHRTSLFRLQSLSVGPWICGTGRRLIMPINVYLDFFGVGSVFPSSTIGLAHSEVAGVYLHSICLNQSCPLVALHFLCLVCPVERLHPVLGLSGSCSGQVLRPFRPTHWPDRCQTYLFPEGLNCGFFPIERILSWVTWFRICPLIHGCRYANRQPSDALSGQVSF